MYNKDENQIYIRFIGYMLKTKKMQVYKPGSVFTKWRMPIIYLDQILLLDSSCLPTKIELAVLELLLIWHCNAMGLLAIIVTNKSRELLPHIFTFSTPTAW